MTFPYENVLAHVLFADSAQPRKASNVTRPFPILWVGSGDETRGVVASERKPSPFMRSVNNNNNNTREIIIIYIARPNWALADVQA